MEKYLTLILQKSFPRDFSINQLGGNVEIIHKSSNSQSVSKQKIGEKMIVFLEPVFKLFIQHN